jgi:ATP-dependent Clp protease ATP-binding subunit ClpA
MPTIPNRAAHHFAGRRPPMSDEIDEIIEYEEIDSDEVDRVVAALEDLGATVSSENIKLFLEEAATNIYYLVYDDEEDAAAA